MVCLFELERLRQYPIVQDLLSLELIRIRAALLNDSSITMGHLAWPRCPHEGHEVLPKTLTTHVSALYYRHNITLLGFLSRSKKTKSPN